MKKLLTLAVLGLFISLPLAAQAQMGSELELSGNLTSTAGWQRTLKNAGNAATGIFDSTGAHAALATKGTDEFGFVVDQIELDLAKSFGENIAMRADLDFSPHSSLGVTSVEQAYVTMNIPAGNGVEFLVGRFNAGIGYDSVDKNELSTMSFSMPRRVLLPLNVTGARFGYQASDAVWFDFFVVNDLQDSAPFGVAGAAAATSDYPSMGLNLKYSWGDDDAASWVNLSAAAGAESATNKDLTYLGDLSANLALMDGSLDLGLEALYRLDSNVRTGTADGKTMGGLLQATYAFSDIWDGTLRYGFTWDNDAVTPPSANAWTGAATATGVGADLTAKGKLHDLTLATGYQITDGAKLVVEGRFDVWSPSGGSTGYSAGLGTLFAYSF